LLEDLKIYKKMIKYRDYLCEYGLKWPLFLSSSFWKINWF